MASNAIFRQKRFISHYGNSYIRTIQSLQWTGHVGQNTGSLDSISNNDDPSAIPNHGIGNRIAPPAKKSELLNFTGLQKFRHICYSIPISNHGDFNVYTPGGIGLISRSVRNASTSAAKQPDLTSDEEENNELVAKKRKEASPEECDQAVEGLSTAKAKAKARRLQESQSIVTATLRRLWAVVIGIGPALRAVASMSRLTLFSMLSLGINFLIPSLYIVTLPYQPTRNAFCNSRGFFIPFVILCINEIISYIKKNFVLRDLM